MKYLYLAITIILFASCEDVIDLPLAEGPKRLVIDANINWTKDSSGKSPGNEQAIKLTETVGYYDLTIPPATGAAVRITNSTGDVTDFIEDGASGIYRTSSFVPALNETYTLSIEYKGETFSAEETLMPVANIDSISQSTDDFFGEEVIRVDFYYTDPIDEENYYVNQFNYDFDYPLDTYRAFSDEFTNGNTTSVFEQDDSLEAGQELILYFYGASKTFYNYTDLLLEQITSGGPFSTPPASVKGNCINLTNPDAKPLGYFRLSEMFVERYIIQ